MIEHVLAFRYKNCSLSPPRLSWRLLFLGSAVFFRIYLLSSTPTSGRGLKNQNLKYVESGIEVSGTTNNNMFNHRLGLVSMAIPLPMLMALVMKIPMGRFCP